MSRVGLLLKNFLYHKYVNKAGQEKVKICGVPLSWFTWLLNIKKQGYKYKIYILGVRVFLYNKKFSPVKLQKYAEWLYDLKNNQSLFVPFEQKQITRTENGVKVFAYYLPQYHAIKENDEAYGKGFTEWTNVASAVPQFVGHYQPKIPYDLGFYNLLQPGVMERQVEIAKAYGLYGFCFYYYWFSGKKVLEKPLEYFLNSSIDFKFHFCWANENWSKLWDGGNKEIILEQKVADDDAEKFFTDILPYIKDERYEKIDNKPILMIYRPAMFEKEKFLSFIGTLNQLAQKEGFDGFYIMAAGTFGFNNPKEYGCEGVIEFPPHNVLDYCKPVSLRRVIKSANFTIVDIKPYIQKKLYLDEPEYTVFKTVFPSWDNTPRKLYSNGICFQMDDEDFENWLMGTLEWTKNHNNANEQYLYINAWNEWAEGAMLEPTTRYGYRKLAIMRKCLEQTGNIKYK